MPASKASFVRAMAESGVSLEGLMTTAQPAANASAILRVIIAARKFHGVMILQTPTGSLKVITVVLAYEEGITSPYERMASSANYATEDAAYLTSPSASARGLPFSNERIAATYWYSLATTDASHRFYPKLTIVLIL